jgi:hypothetical protein
VAQVFHRSTNTLSRLSIFGAVFFAGFVLYLVLEINRAPYVTRAGEVRDQPIPFSHQHHVGGIGIDCRYCHTSVEVSASAGMPPTKTCMNCHSQIWNRSPMLEPVRASFRSGESIEWTRVHDLPDFVYFNHGAHVNRGIGCVSCHGRVDRMPLMYQEKSLQMEWCLECHRNPERFVRPIEHVFDVAWTWEALGPDHSQEKDGPVLVKQYNLRPRTSCNTCHR